MDASTLQQALQLAEAAPTVRQAAATLRERLAPLRVVVVDRDDMRGETPALEGAQVALFLGASDGHCWQVTQDPAQAAGLFITGKA